MGHPKKRGILLHILHTIKKGDLDQLDKLDTIKKKKMSPDKQ